MQEEQVLVETKEYNLDVCFDRKAKSIIFSSLIDVHVTPDLTQTDSVSALTVRRCPLQFIFVLFPFSIVCHCALLPPLASANAPFIVVTMSRFCLASQPGTDRFNKHLKVNSRAGMTNQLPSCPMT